MDSTLVKVDFHGDSIWAERTAGDVIVAVKPIVESLGMAWNAQLERIKRDEALAGSMRVTRIETPAGSRESVGLSLNVLPGFLFGISTERITDPEVKAKVLAYKRECHAVLYAHFFGGVPQSDDLDWDEIGLKLGLVKEARLQHGRKVSAVLWIDLGLPMPQHAGEVKVASPQGMDFVRQFLAERTDEQPGGRVNSTVLYEAYQSWAAETDGEATMMTHTGFALTLNRLGIRKGSVTGRKFYLGLRIRHRLELDGGG